MKTPLPPQTSPDPIVEVRYETRLICPVELERPIPVRPSVPEDAVVQVNESGGDFLAGELAFGSSLLGLFVDARQACREAARP